MAAKQSLAFLALLFPVLVSLIYGDPSAAPTMAPSDGARKVHYVSWIESFNEAAADWDPTSLGAEELTEVANADDLSTRFSFLGTGLDGKFPFLGKMRYEMNVNSNGWLQFDSVNSPPCQLPRYVPSSLGTIPISFCFLHFSEHWSAIPERTFNTTYYGGVAAFAGDLYPAYNYPASSVKWSNTSTGDGIIIHWVDNPFYHYKTAKITVHSRLTRDGHVSIYWEDLDYSQSTCEGYGGCNAGRLISGLRDSISSLENSYLSTTSQQDNNALHAWSTKVKGVYPSGGVSDLQSGKIFHLCPYSDSWSLTNSYLEQNAVTANITFHTLHSSCEEQFDYFRCTYTSTTASSPTVHTGFATFNGTADGYPSYECGVPQSVLSTLDTYKVDLQGVFSTAVQSESGASTTAHSLLSETDRNADTFVVEVVASGTPSLYFSDPCIISSVLSLPDVASGCGVCSLGKNLTTCVTQGLSCLSVDSPVDCQGQCPYTIGPVPMSYGYDSNTFITYNYSSYSYVYKTSSDCCNTTEIDCAGICSGGRKIAPTLTARSMRGDGSAMYDNSCCDPLLLTPDGTGCCYDSIPDCTGTCGGNATVDCLGICQTWMSQGTWTDCTGKCGGSAVLNACGDCFNGTAGLHDPYSSVTAASECRASLTVINPSPYSSLTTGDRSFLMNLRNLNLSQYLESDTFVNVRLDVSYRTSVDAPSAKQNVTLAITNPRNYTMNVSVSDELWGSTYRDKYPTLSFDSTPFLLPAYGAAAIVVTVETSDVYRMEVQMSTDDPLDWAPKPLTVTSVPALREGMFSSTNEVQYDVILYPVTSDCGVIPDAASCGYAPWCIFCITSNPGRSLLERREQETPHSRNLYVSYTMALRTPPNYHGDLGGLCVSGFEQDDCEHVIMSTEATGISLEAMAYWLPITLLLLAAIVLIVQWSMKLPEA